MRIRFTTKPGVPDTCTTVTELLAPLGDGGHSLVSGGDAANHFHPLHRGHRIEEVHADDAFRLPGSGGNIGNRNRRCIAGENRIRGANAVELSEQRTLQIFSLADGFDDDTEPGKLGQLGGRLNASHDGVDVFF
jgi:hypothetical protein